jgi:hypothetical protein
MTSPKAQRAAPQRHHVPAVLTTGYEAYQRTGCASPSVVPGSPKTAKLVMNFDCAPVGIMEGYFNVVGRTSDGTEVYHAAHRCETSPSPANPYGCGGPGNGFAITPTVSVPAGTLVSWDIRDVTLRLPGDLEIGLDPWVIAPFDKGCTALSGISRCLLPFTANDPEDPIFGKIE